MDIKKIASKKVNLPWKKIIRISGNVLVIFVFVFALLMILSKSGIGSLRILTVKSGSMSPALYTGSIIFVSPHESYEAGDIITFRGQGEKEYVTHRIIEADSSAEQPAYRTKGDANDAPDAYKVPQNGITGKVRISIPLIGYILDFVKTVPGLILIIVIPSTIIIYEEIKKIKKEWSKVKQKREERKKVEEEHNKTFAKKTVSKKERLIEVFTKHRKLFILAVVLSGSLLFFQPAQAATQTSGDLTIDYPDGPLFNETNIAPGFAISKPITVTNNADEEKGIGVQFSSDSYEELNEVLIFSIQQNGNTIYGGSTDPKTLSDLINAGEIGLTSLAATQSADFTITAELDEMVDNTYQDKVSVFDLSVGFQESEEDFSIPPINTPPVPTNTNNTNGIILGEEEEGIPPKTGKILGEELGTTGYNLITYSLVVIALAIITYIVIKKAWIEPRTKEKDQ